MKEIVNGKLRTIKKYEPKSLEEKIQYLLDLESIKETIHMYADCADKGDYDGMIACFTEDCVTSYSFETNEENEQTPLRFSREQTYDFLKRRLVNRVLSGSHYLSNEQILFESPNQAIVYCYLYSWQRFIQYPNQADWHRSGRYELNLVKEEDGEWRIKSLQLLVAVEEDPERYGEQFQRLWPPISLKNMK